MTGKERYELVERVSQLPPGEQLALIEELIRRLRQASTDQVARERDLDALVADPEMQRVLSNQDLVHPNVAG